MRKESLSVDGSELLEDPKRANTASAEYSLQPARNMDSA